jgi:hypothetical protein
MKRLGAFFLVFCLAGLAMAGFKVKLVKPKKPEQFMARTSAAGATYAADLLVDGGTQKDFFYKELIPSNIIAVRLAVFNGGDNQVELPLDSLQLIGPDGKECPLVAPEVVSKAVLDGLVVTSAEKKNESPVKVLPNTRIGDPRTDRTDPRYDPRLDPTDPSYDPSDPRVRNDPNIRRNGSYGGPWIRPGVDVILNPGGRSGGGDLSRFEKSLVEKDFSDKAHSAEPVLPSMNRDRFLYFSIKAKPETTKGYTLRLPPAKGFPHEIVLKF